VLIQSFGGGLFFHTGFVFIFSCGGLGFCGGLVGRLLL